MTARLAPIRKSAGCLIALALLALTPALSQAASTKTQKPPAVEAPPSTEQATPKPAPYDERLSRFAEILGSVHYLRTLCDPTATENWRGDMQALLQAETGDEPARREMLTAAFNRGYRAFASVYTQCTPAAVTAEEGYRREGATLAGEIAARFGN